MVRQERGIVIIVVLWICALIMWFALQISSDSRLRGEENIHLLRRSQALYLAIGGAYEAIARMGQQVTLDLDQSEDQVWQPNGDLHEVQYETGRAFVAIEVETDKVNVNLAEQMILRDILEKRGVNESDADELADVIADFIDPDDLPRLHGAEKDSYRQLGLHYEPFNGPLKSLDQMLLIPGISPKLFFGYGSQKEENSERSSDLVSSLTADGGSLFEMLTVYGKNEVLKDEGVSETDQLDFVPWEAGETYRILSRGEVSSGPPSVILWLVVRYRPESADGYEVLFRKIL